MSLYGDKFWEAIALISSKNFLAVEMLNSEIKMSDEQIFLSFMNLLCFDIINQNEPKRLFVYVISYNALKR